MDIAPQIAPLNSIAAALVGDPKSFGRVGEDGTVYVITESGEKAVGSYPGKSPEDALAYFVRKFEAVASEVVLLAARIKSGAMVPSDAHTAVGKLRQQIAVLNGVGNLAALAASVENIPPLIDEHKIAYDSRKEKEALAKETKRQAAIVIKEKIVVEAETHSGSENWKLTSERLKELLDDWKKAPRLDKKSDSELWHRFSASRNKFDKRRRLHFANLLQQQSAVKSAKETIVLEAEVLSKSSDWVSTARRYKALMDLWKISGRGKKTDDAKLWARFKVAQDHFFATKNADLEKRGSTMASNLAKREELIVEIEGLLPITNFDDARRKFRDLQSKWSKIGMTERGKRSALDARLQKVEESIKELEAEKWRKSDPGAKARANDVVTQISSAIADYQVKAEKAEAAGNIKKALELREAANARKAWLAEAEKGLAEFSH